MFDLKKVFGNNKDKEIQKNTITREQVAKILETEPEALKAFEEAYTSFIQTDEPTHFFEMNSRQASEQNAKTLDESMRETVDQIVEDLLAQTVSYTYDGHNVTVNGKKALPEKNKEKENELAVKLNQLPIEIRPQLTGSLMTRDIEEPAYFALAFYMDMYQKTGDKFAYNHFRQGLDILDLDEITYQIIDRNKNSIGHWLPKLVDACHGKSELKIPATTVVKVPLTLLQLTRRDYNELNPTTFAILDQWAYRAFKLSEEKDYFIKTGTYSSKFDFRNAWVKGEKEVRELGEYLLFIHHQALQMASPLVAPHPIYGVSTTTEWVVREFIHDKENNPSIYKGLPLHTEYRVFVDCDTDEIIGISPYWEPETMKKRFQQGNDIHNWHDYQVYKNYEHVLMERFNSNQERVKEMVHSILPDLKLNGQWSIDVMQNGEDFWVIDMALAEQSAFYNCVPKELRRVSEEDWIPKLTMSKE